MPFKCQECYGNLYIFEDISSTEFQLFKSHSPLHILVIFYNFQIFIYYCCRGLSSVRYACNGKLHILYLIMHCSSHKHFHHSWLEFWNGKIMFLFLFRWPTWHAQSPTMRKEWSSFEWQHLKWRAFALRYQTVKIPHSAYTVQLTSVLFSSVTRLVYTWTFFFWRSNLAAPYQSFFPIHLIKPKLIITLTSL